MSLPIFNERAQAILMHECLDLQRFEEIQKQHYATNKHSLENRQYQHFFKFGDYVIYAKWINEILQHTSNRRSGDLENQIEKILQATYPSFDIEANGDLIPKIIKSSQIT